MSTKDPVVGHGQGLGRGDDTHEVIDAASLGSMGARIIREQAEEETARLRARIAELEAERFEACLSCQGGARGSQCPACGPASSPRAMSGVVLRRNQ